MVSAAAIPALPGADGVVGVVEGAAQGIVTGVTDGHMKRQLEVAQPVTEGVKSSLNGGTGIVGSAVGTVESTGQGAVGTAESAIAGAGHVKRESDSLSGSDNAVLGDSIGEITRSASMLPVAGVVGTAESTIAGAGHVKRQLEVVKPVAEGVASSLNGGTGIVGSAVGTAESTSQGAVYTVENSVSGIGKCTPSTTSLYRGHTANHTAVAKRQFGNLPATAQQTGTDVLAGLSGSKLS